MTRRTAFGIGLGVLVATSAALGLAFRTSPLEPISEPIEIESHGRATAPLIASIDDATQRLIFAQGNHAAWVFFLPPGLEHQEPGEVIVSPDGRWILAFFGQARAPSFLEEIGNGLFDTHTSRMQWTLWRFSVVVTGPTTRPVPLATLRCASSPNLLVSEGQVVVSPVVAAGPEWEKRAYYRVRL